MAVNNSDNYSFLSKEALDELKEIHFRETGKMMTDDEALAMAKQLFRLYRVLYAKAKSIDSSESSGTLRTRNNV